MGLFGTLWIQDMMDASNGFGSWQLSMNAGLAHMQATSLLNSCWTPSGFGFMPYSQLDSMSYLLNPNFAAQQAMNGISSGSSTSIFGNWGGMNSGFTNNPGFNPWGNSWNNIGNNGKTDDTDSPERKEDAENEEQADDLKSVLNEYANYLTTSNNRTDRKNGEKLLKEIEEIEKKGSWEDVKNALEKLYNKTLTDNSASYAKYIAQKRDLEIDGKTITDLIQNTGFENTTMIDKNEYISKAVADINKEINSMSKNGSRQDTLDSLCRDKDNILAVISYYNSSYSSTLIEDFVNKFNDSNTFNGDDVTGIKDTAIGGLRTLINGLTLKANDLTSYVDEDTKESIENLIKELNDYNLSDDTIDDGIITTFNDLYKLVRLAEVKKVENDIDAQYAELGNKKISDLLKLRQTTIMDLAKELSETDEEVGALADSIEYVSAGHSVDVTNRDSNNGNGGIENNNNSAIQAYIDDGTLSDTGKTSADGLKIYVVEQEGLGLPKGTLCRLKNKNGDRLMRLTSQEFIKYNLDAGVIEELGKINGLTIYSGLDNQGVIEEGRFYVLDGNDIRPASDEELEKIYLDYGDIKVVANTTTQDNRQVYKYVGEDLEEIKKNDLCYFENGELKKYES